MGNIERYKAKLVVKGFTQKEEIDYTKTSSHVSKKDFLHIILALVAHFNMKLHQMDGSSMVKKKEWFIFKVHGVISSFKFLDNVMD